jgi:hypothetical protein
MTNVEKWNAKIAEMKANRDERFGRTPKSKELEEKLMVELEAIYSELTPAEQDSVEKLEPPRYRSSLIAQDQYGRLIGFEDLDD